LIRQVRQRAINLTFHGLGEPGRPLEPGEAEVWLGTDEFEFVLDSVSGRDDVRISFDDGNASDVSQALPALEQRGLTATFFVVAGRLRVPGFLDEAGLRTLTAEGMSVGCHGMRHRPWRGLGAAELHEELVDAKDLLEDIVARPVTEASCPFGAYDRRVLRTLRRSGYRHVYTSDRGTARPGHWLQARNTVHRGDRPGIVDRVLSDERAPSELARRRAKRVAKRWR
jgi:peptidoglycan/xylan/chitin deacetylase (PgdA/CDA1 family)